MSAVTEYRVFRAEEYQIPRLYFFEEWAEFEVKPPKSGQDLKM